MTSMSMHCESDAVEALKNELSSFVNDGSDWSRRRMTRLRAEIRNQRVRDARARGTHSEDEWVELVARFDGRCVICGCNKERMEKDHILPLYMGGSDAIGNLQPLCRACNASKGPSTFNWAEYREAYGFGGVLL